jgi:hypothetical protein
MKTNVQKVYARGHTTGNPQSSRTASKGRMVCTPPTKRLTLDIQTKRGMPGFACYLAGTVKTGRVQIRLNIDALLWAMVDDEPGEFRRHMIDCLAHEFIHACEDHFGLLFDEAAVEASIARVRKEQKPA